MVKALKPKDIHLLIRRFGVTSGVIQENYVLIRCDPLLLAKVWEQWYSPWKQRKLHTYRIYFVVFKW